jgi:hypothetical protein
MQRHGASEFMGITAQQLGLRNHYYGLIEAHFVDAPIAELRSGG